TARQKNRPERTTNWILLRKREGRDLGLSGPDRRLSCMLLSETIEDNKKLVFPVKESNKSRLEGKLGYWWSWFVAGSLLLLVASPALIFLWIINRRTWLYP